MPTTGCGCPFVILATNFLVGDKDTQATLALLAQYPYKSRIHIRDTEFSPD